MTPKYHYPATLALTTATFLLIIGGLVFAFNDNYRAAWACASWAAFAATTDGTLLLVEIRRAQRRAADLRHQLAIAKDARDFARQVANMYHPDSATFNTKENK